MDFRSVIDCACISEFIAFLNCLLNTYNIDFNFATLVEVMILYAAMWIICRTAK